MKNKYLIYKLIDPRTNEIRYIGKTKNSLKKRLYEHLTKRNLTPKTHKNNWIKSLLKENLKPIIEKIEEVNEDNWIEREIYYIQHFKNKGINLTNGTNGGDGALGTKQSKDSINKRLETMRKKYGKNAFKISEETKQKMSESAKGRVHSLERRDKDAEKNRKVLLQLDLNGQLIKKWYGVRKCAREINVDYATLRYHIRLLKPLNDFIWTY